MRQILALLSLVLMLNSCEEVIDVELNEAPPKLVIDASIDWFKNTQGNQQQIKLSLSAPYFDTEIPPATGAIVSISNDSGISFNFIEEGDSGTYSTDQFIPVINQEYTLTINYKDNIYTATEVLKPVVEFDYVEQNNDGGFSGEETELKVYYTDPVEEDNYYFFEFFNEDFLSPTLEVYEDEFTNGNQIFGFYTDEDLEPGHQVVIRNHGVSQRFYDYMFKLLQQNGDTGGGPFETQPASIRGNCQNLTNPADFPLGYFRASETVELVYIVE